MEPPRSALAMKASYLYGAGDVGLRCFRWRQRTHRGGQDADCIQVSVSLGGGFDVGRRFLPVAVDEDAELALDAFEAGVDLSGDGVTLGFVAGTLLEGEVGGVALLLAGLGKPGQGEEIPVAGILVEV